MLSEFVFLELGAIPSIPFPRWESLAESLHHSVPQFSQPIGTKKGRKEVAPFVPLSLES